MLNEAYITRQFYSRQPAPEGPYCLSLYISDHFFMYAICINGFNEVIELCHIEWPSNSNNAESLADRMGFLTSNYFLNQKKFSKINIACLSHDFNLVPEAFASDNQLKQLLNFSTGLAAIKSPATHLVKGVKFSFSLPADLLSFLERSFPNAAIRHSAAITSVLFFSQHSLSKQELFLNIHDGDVELAIKDKNDLRFYNVFSYQGNEDILYFLLFTMEQFELSPLQVKLVIACQRPVTDEVIVNIKKYIKHVSFCAGVPSLVLNDELAKLPQHYYFTLLNQHTCEL